MRQLRIKLMVTTGCLLATAPLAGLGIAGGLGGASAEPPRVAVPVERCGPGDRPETGLQGQVPQTDRLAGRAVQGYTCNLTLVGRFQSQGALSMDAYRNCVYYGDNLFPGSEGKNGGPGAEGGVVVLDVSDPRRPKKTAYLTSKAMRNGGEGVLVNQRRGLLAASYYDQPYFAIYDISKDCRHPVLLADKDYTGLADPPTGHGGCFQPDGNVWYMAGNQAGHLTPVDITDPRRPRLMRNPWPRSMHDCAFLGDGKVGYFADNGLDTLHSDGGFAVVDTSQVQKRAKNPAFTALSLSKTPDALVQNTVQAFTRGGHKYVFNASENTGIPLRCGNALLSGSSFGYGRIYNVDSPRRPVEVSKIMTEVMLPENCPKIAGDYSTNATNALVLYDLHQCRTDRIYEATILGCSAFSSGMRVWDIRDPLHPKEIAYFNTGQVSPTELRLDTAGAAPVFRRDLGMVFWQTGVFGFHAAKFRKGVWPFLGDDPCPVANDWRAEQYDATWKACRAARGDRRTASRVSQEHPAR